ncbi:hypothetical protein B566_EDAN009335 [Ephemera danica]|nr:hypothetical protein B566_EDAN009335 [Ephemera danica]
MDWGSKTEKRDLFCYLLRCQLITSCCHRWVPFLLCCYLAPFTVSQAAAGVVFLLERDRHHLHHGGGCQNWHCLGMHHHCPYTLQRQKVIHYAICLEKAYRCGSAKNGLCQWSRVTKTSIVIMVRPL